MTGEAVRAQAGVVPARVVGRSVLPLLGRGRGGVVLAGFSRSCYLDLHGQVVAVVCGDLPAGPFTVVVEGTPPFSLLRPGEPVTVREDAVEVGGSLWVNLAAAVPWDATLTPWAGDRGRLADHLALLRDLLLEAAPPAGLGRPAVGEDDDGPLARAARPGLHDLAAALRDQDPSAAADAARRLAGLGPGLTPSGDDVLTGCLVALTLWPPRGRSDLRRLIADQAVPRTTRISAAYLAAAARGEAGQRWHDLRDALAGPDPAAVRRAAAQVMALGETSGSDMLGGFVLAAQAVRAAA